MYDYLRGSIAHIAKDGVTIDVQGVGYKVITTAQTAQGFSQKQEAVQLFVSFVVREFEHTLYGFVSTQERNLFEALLNISGIGPKMALAMIGHIEPNNLQRAVLEKDIPALCKIPGIGKKTAERLLVELRDILSSFQFYENITRTSQINQDAVSALIHLGYSQSIAQKAVQQAVAKHTEKTELSRLITLALQEV